MFESVCMMGARECESECVLDKREEGGKVKS